MRVSAHDGAPRIGSLMIANTQPNAYSPEEVRFCSLVADQIALATDDAFNFQASQQAHERLELLLDLTNRVVSRLNLREVLRALARQRRRPLAVRRSRQAAEMKPCAL